MPERRVVIDGSNIATEGRSLPSLAQLRDAVAAFRAENPHDAITVVVDASFSYRIEEAERDEFEESRTTGELVSPPAGAIGRGDGFLLQIADRTGAVVLSNDSFQEYHGEYEWLFDKGRLMGGTPVPGVGWIFTLRTPVRGPKSREAVKEAKKRSRGPKAKPIEDAIAEATEDVLESPTSTKRHRRRRGGKGPSPEAVNDPVPFINFIARHPLGSEVTGEVDRFASHGAFVNADGAVCYLPLTAMGDPPPRAAREVLRKGEPYTFVLQALDAPRRGIELALPGFAHVAAQPTEETVEAEITEASAPAKGSGRRRRGRGSAAAAPEPAPPPARERTARAPAARRAASESEPAAAATATGTGRGRARRRDDAAAADVVAPARAARAKKATKSAATVPATDRAARAKKAAPAKTAQTAKTTTKATKASKASKKTLAEKTLAEKTLAKKTLGKKQSAPAPVAKRATTTTQKTQKTPKTQKKTAKQPLAVTAAKVATPGKTAKKKKAAPQRSAAKRATG